MANNYVGAYEIIQMVLTTVDEVKHNIRFVQSECNVYQDLFNNQTTADILVTDTTNMIQNLPLFGFETLLLEFKTPHKNTTFKKTFRLFNISNRTLLKERCAAYILHFVSVEAINNLKVRVSKSYKGALVSDIVYDLHKNWLKGGSIIIEPTKFQQHIIIPKLNPCHAINWLAMRANSAMYEGANYLYYEDKDQFQFVSMESRLAQPVAQHYTFQPANIRKDGLTHHAPDLPADVIAMQTYTFENSSNILENLQSGMYGNELITYSQTRKLWKDYTFDYPQSFDKYKHLYPGNYLFNAKFNDDKPDSRLKFHSTGHDQDGYPTMPEKWIPCRISQLQQLQNVKISLTIPGDSDRTIGEVIELRLPSPEPTIQDQQIDDKYYNGRFLVQSVRHTINRDKFLTHLLLIKDSSLVPFPK
jgi:hypothetical protein